MTKNDIDGGKVFALAILSTQYQELKNRRAELLSQAQKWVESELESEREELSSLVIKARDENGASISDLMEALGTTSRKTVYNYLNRGK